jgi:hypothetical protein
LIPSGKKVDRRKGCRWDDRGKAVIFLREDHRFSVRRPGPTSGDAARRLFGGDGKQNRLPVQSLSSERGWSVVASRPLRQVLTLQIVSSEASGNEGRTDCSGERFADCMASIPLVSVDLSNRRPASSEGGKR